MDTNNVYKNIYKSINNLKLYIHNNHSKIKNYNDSYLILVADNNLSDIQPEIKKEKNLLSKKMNNLELVDTYIKFIKYFFNIYLIYLPMLLKLEDSYYKLSREISNIIHLTNKIKFF